MAVGPDWTGIGQTGQKQSDRRCIGFWLIHMSTAEWLKNAAPKRIEARVKQEKGLQSLTHPRESSLSFTPTHDHTPLTNY